MRFRAVILWTIGFLVAALVAAMVTLSAGGGPAVAWVLQYPVSAALGRQIRIGGPVTVAWGSTTRITIEDLHIANASWGSGPDLLAAGHAEIDVVPTTLILGPTRVPLVTLDGASLLLETSQQGEKNWQTAAAAPAPKKRGEFPYVQKLTIANSHLIFHNGETEARSTLDVSTLDFTAPEIAGSVAIKMDGRFQQLPLKFSANTAALAELRAPEKPYPIKVDGSLAEARFTVEGTVAEPLDFTGLDVRLSLSGRDLHDVTDALGMPFPELPDFRGTAKLSGGDGDWTLGALTLAVGKSDLEGGLKVDTRQKVPQVQMNLTSRRLDLADFKGLYGRQPTHAPKPAKLTKPEGQVLPETPIDTGKLPAVNIDVSFDGARVTPISGAPIERVSLGLHLKDGDLLLQPLRFQVGHGDVDIKAHFTPFTKESAPKVSAQVDVRHVNLRELLQNTASETWRQTAGVVGGFVRIDSTGASMHEIVGHMTGDAGFFMENGQVSHLLEVLAPIDVLKALGVYISGDKPVPINCAILRLALKDGVAASQTLLVDTQDTVVQGGGGLNFADESLNLTFTPLNKHFTVLSLRAPIDVHGKFSALQYDLHTGVAIARLGAAVVFPPAAVLTLVDQGLGENNACARAYAAQQPQGKPEPRPPR